MLHFQNMREKFLQHPDKIPFLQTFRMVSHGTWRTNVAWKKTVYVNKTGIFSFFQNQPKYWME